MTQMLLFDPPAQYEEFAPSVTPVAEIPSQPKTVCPSDADRGGMHHMGDLARLVLMRYELVAQRRAALAAKRAK